MRNCFVHYCILPRAQCTKYLQHMPGGSQCAVGGLHSHQLVDKTTHRGDQRTRPSYTLKQ